MGAPPQTLCHTGAVRDIPGIVDVLPLKATVHEPTGRAVADSEVTLERHLLASKSDSSWEIPASRVKHGIALRTNLGEITAEYGPNL
jgi:hypothetical protein